MNDDAQNSSGVSRVGRSSQNVRFLGGVDILDFDLHVDRVSHPHEEKEGGEIP